MTSESYSILSTFLPKVSDLAWSIKKLLLQGQLIDSYFLGDDFSVTKLDLFQQLVRDYRENFCPISEKRQHHGLFYGQMVLLPSLSIAPYLVLPSFAQ